MLKSTRTLVSKYWLFLFVIMQPLLDVLAFWTSSETGTVAGYIRLAFMVILPLHLLIFSDKRKKVFGAMAVIAFVAVLHMANLFRLGYINVVVDVKNMAKIFYMPVISACLCFYVKDEQSRKQLVAGLFANVLILAAVIIVSYVTGTYNPTYGYGLGTSAWVTDPNRCTHSVILSALSIFAMYFGLNSSRKLINYLTPVIVIIGCISNGTSSCYLTCLACCAGFAAFMVFSSLIKREKMSRAGKLLAVYLVLLFAVTVAIYPVTPRAKITAFEKAAADKRQNTLEDELIALGFDIRNMTAEEKMNEPVVREKMARFYTEAIYGGAPGLIETYDVYRIMEAYDMSTDARTIADTRRMKRVFAHLTWEDSDFATKLTGFEFTKMEWPGDTLDLENDWHAIFYYYGVVGFAFYGAYMLWFVYLVLRKLKGNFAGNLTLYNFCLILSLFILIGLAHFSGALLKRPNSSIYLAFVLALLHYQTVYEPAPVLVKDVQ